MKKRGFFSFIFGILVILAGILVISYRHLFLRIVVVCAGLYALYDGFSTLFSLKKWNFSGASSSIAKIKAIELVVVGAFAVIVPVFTASAMFTVLMYIFGFGLIISALATIENAIALKKLVPETKTGSFFVKAAVDLAIAVLLMINSMQILDTAIIVIGTLIIAMGVCLLLYAWKASKEK